MLANTIAYCVIVFYHFKSFMVSFPCMISFNIAIESPSLV